MLYQYHTYAIPPIIERTYQAKNRIITLTPLSNPSGYIHEMHYQLRNR